METALKPVELAPYPVSEVEEGEAVEKREAQAEKGRCSKSPPSSQHSAAGSIKARVSCQLVNLRASLENGG